MKRLYIGQRVYLKTKESYGTVIILYGEAADKGGIRIKYIKINLDNGNTVTLGQSNLNYSGYVSDKDLDSIQEIDGAETEGNSAKKIKELEKTIEDLKNLFLNHAHKLRTKKDNKTLEELTSKPKKA